MLGAVGACSGFGADDSGPSAVDGGAPVADAVAASDAGQDGGTEVEASADAGRPFRWVFVTSAVHDGHFGDGDGGLEGADTFCANQLLGTSLSGLRWRAWLGDSATDPRARIADGGAIPYEYRLLTGEVVFRQGFRFVAGALRPLHAIDRDEHGDAAADLLVWTGSDDQGFRFPSIDGHCVGWTTRSTNGITGWTTYQGDTKEWTHAASGTVDRACTFEHHLYCFEVDP